MHFWPTITQRKALLFALFVAMAVTGCSSKTSFAGFTFGGGGHTHSAEPAVITFGKPSRLVAGSPDQPIYLSLEWDSDKTDFSGEKLPLTKAHVKVDSQGESDQLVDGQIVLQARQGKIGNGSFQFQVKLEDGREFPVVGSFSASVP